MKRLILSIAVLCMSTVFADAVTINTSVFTGTEGGNVIAVSGDTAISGDSYEVGSSVTFTAPATDDKGNAFVQWAGDLVDENTKTTNPLTLSVSKGGTLRPVYANMWLLTKDSDTAKVGQIADMLDNWIFRIGEIDSKNFTFWNGENSGQTSYKQGSGDVDLSAPVCDEAGNQWIAVGVQEYAFRASNMTRFVAPFTWRSFSGRALNTMGQTSLTNIVLDCPELTGQFPEDFLSGNNIASNIVFKLPKLTGIAAAALKNVNSQSRLGESNAGEWNFDGLKSIGDGVFSWMNFYGDLALPSIETIGTSTFEGDVNIKSVKLGTKNGTVKSIGKKAFRKCYKLEKLVVMGSDDGWSIDSEAFLNESNLTEIVVLSAPPANLSGTIFSWNTDTTTEKEKTIGLFVLESETNQWDAIVSLVQSVDENDSALVAYKAAHPDCGKILGVIPAGVFSAKKQFFGIVEKLSDYGAGMAVSYSVESANAADTIDGPDMTKLYDYGDKVTFTAKLAPDSAFLKWEGLPEGVEQGETVTLTVGKDPVNLVLRTQPVWTYNPEAKTITNGDWVLNVYVPDSKYPNNLGLGNGEWQNGNAYNVDGENGFLDLSGLVLDSDKNQYKFTHISQAAFRVAADHPCPIARIVFPAGIISANRTFLSNEDAPAVSLLKEVEINWPDYEGALPAQSLLEQTSLSKLILKVPLATKIEERFMQDAKNLSETVCTTDFDLRSVEEICQYAFNETKMSGVLNLPSVTNIGYKAFMSCSKINSLIFGTNYKISDYKPFILSKQVFSGNSSLNTIEFGPYATYSTSDKNAFEGCKNLCKVTFTGRPPSHEFLSDLVQAATPVASASAASKTLVIYGSENLGWKDIVCKDEVSNVEILPEEEANAPVLEEGQRILGIYKSLDGSRKAWIVHQSSGFDPKGTVLIIR